MNVPSNEEATKLYNELKSIPLETWVSADFAGLQDDVEKNEELTQTLRSAGAGAAEAVSALRLFARVAHATSPDEFCESVQAGEMPAIKLSAAELELVRGGIAGAIVGVFCVGLICGMALAYCFK